MNVTSQDVADTGHKYLYMCGINSLTHRSGLPVPTPQKINQPEQVFQSEMRPASRYDHIRGRFYKISEVQRNLA